MRLQLQVRQPQQTIFSHKAAGRAQNEFKVFALCNDSICNAMNHFGKTAVAINSARGSYCNPSLWCKCCCAPVKCVLNNGLARILWLVELQQTGTAWLRIFYVSHCSWQFAHVAGTKMQLVGTQEQMHQDACCVLHANYTCRGCMCGYSSINSRSTLDDARMYSHTSGGGAKAMDCVVLYVPRCLSFSKAVGFLVSLASLKVASLFVSVSLSNT